jgi:DNA-binding IclR family transcriptional regulator
MKIELNLILYKLTIALKRRRKLLTTQECANRLGLHKQTLYRLKKLGKLKTHGYAITGSTKQKHDLYDWHEVKESYHHD